MSDHTTEPHRPALLRCGETCWRIEKAGRVAVIVETSNYFEAFCAACRRAEHSIFILGWDFDRRERLGRQEDAPTLEAFLCDLLDEKPGLHVYLLLWDYSVIYTAEREWLQGLRLRFDTDQRLCVHYDNAHPVGASQHQKVVVVDEALAFSGGIDLSRWRWDTAEHAPGDKRRIDPDGKSYPPFHDAMMLVDGHAAAALGKLARERWQNAGAAEQAAEARTGANDPWPEDIEPLFTDQSVAIARTFPLYGERAEVREVERLYLETIERARDYVYIENQYFTSRAIARALASRLDSESGPDVILVLPHHTGGWLEQVTMDVLRARLVKRLLAADRHGRLRVLYAFQPGLPDEECISIHAKLVLMDDCFLRVGSANTSGRSMGLDSECDLALEAPGQPGVRWLLHRLLAEHLDCAIEDVEQSREAAGSLARAIDRLSRTEGRSLRKLDVDSASPPLDLDSESDLVDPSEPIDSDYLLRRAVPKADQHPARRRLYLFTIVIVGLLLMAIVWRFTPLSDWLTTSRLAGWLTWLEEPWVRGLTVLAVIVITTLLMVPLSIMVVASALLLGPWLGFACAMTGALISAGIGFVAGESLGGLMIERFSSNQIHRLSKRLSERGILAVAILRLIPVAPFTVVNMVAGASHIRLGKFMLGSAIGLAPGVAGLSLFSGSLYKAVTNPSAESLGILAAVVGVIVLATLGLRRLLRIS